jgi:hypothetical protein
MPLSDVYDTDASEKNDKKLEGLFCSKGRGGGGPFLRNLLSSKFYEFHFLRRRVFVKIVLTRNPFFAFSLFLNGTKTINFYISSTECGKI